MNVTPILRENVIAVNTAYPISLCPRADSIFLRSSSKSSSLHCSFCRASCSFFNLSAWSSTLLLPNVLLCFFESNSANRLHLKRTSFPWEPPYQLQTLTDRINYSKFHWMEKIIFVKRNRFTGNQKPKYDEWIILLIKLLLQINKECCRGLSSASQSIKDIHRVF